MHPSSLLTCRKPTKGIQYLVESQVLDDDPKSVADFLTDDKNKLCKQKIGEFVGEINSDFNMAVLG
jgi:Sec7-like guanine-nucleotide exchange factor